MMKQVIFSKLSSTGQRIEVRTAPAGISSLAAQLFIDGQYCPGPSAPQQLEIPRGEVTHFMGGKTGRPGFTSAEVEQIEAAFRAADLAYRQTPAARAFLEAERARVDALIREDNAVAAMPSTRLRRAMDRADSDR